MVGRFCSSAGTHFGGEWSEWTLSGQSGTQGARTAKPCSSVLCVACQACVLWTEWQVLAWTLHRAQKGLVGSGDGTQSFGEGGSTGVWRGHTVWTVLCYH